MQYPDVIKEKLLASICIDTITGCWVWVKGKRWQGYGGFQFKRKRLYAHIVSYNIFKGEIPAEYTVDHLCRNHACINPAHLEAVTQTVNKLRGIGFAALKARQVDCIHGHSLSGENLYITPNGHRSCRKCRAIREKIRRAKLKSGICIG
jgi:hypothetical protein